MPKQPPCSRASNGKHRWSFVRNTTLKKMTFGAAGSSVQISLRGLYRCECGERKLGQHRVDQPGADVRDHVNKEAA